MSLFRARDGQMRISFTYLWFCLLFLGDTLLEMQQMKAYQERGINNTGKTENVEYKFTTGCRI